MLGFECATAEATAEHYESYFYRKTPGVAYSTKT